MNVWLDFHGFLSLREDFKQFFVRQEIEARKEALLRLKVLVQSFLYFFKLEVTGYKNFG